MGGLKLGRKYKGPHCGYLCWVYGAWMSLEDAVVTKLLPKLPHCSAPAQQLIQNPPRFWRNPEVLSILRSCCSIAPHRYPDHKIPQISLETPKASELETSNIF